MKILFVLWTIFFAAAALHSAWIDAYTMFHVNDDNDNERVGETERERTNETNLFASFHVILLSNSKINKFTRSLMLTVLRTKNYFRLCVWFSREITFCNVNWWIYNFNKRHARAFALTLPFADLKLFAGHTLTHIHIYWGTDDEWGQGMHLTQMMVQSWCDKGGRTSFLLIRL